MQRKVRITLYKLSTAVDVKKSPSVPVVELLSVWVGWAVEVFDLVSDIPDLLPYQGAQGMSNQKYANTIGDLRVYNPDTGGYYKVKNHDKYN